jgi:hypothetical protein
VVLSAIFLQIGALTIPTNLVEAKSVNVSLHDMIIIVSGDWNGFVEIEFRKGEYENSE